MQLVKQISSVPEVGLVCLMDSDPLNTGINNVNLML